MRVIDHRYRCEQRQYDLAIRLVHHNARTRTIRFWTGLSADRVRKLYRAYLTTSEARECCRMRGIAPYQIGFFTRSPRLRTETTVLAGYFRLHGNLVHEAPDRDFRNDAWHRIGVAEQLCATFELFSEIVRGSEISLEHAILLRDALERANQLYIGSCVACGVPIALDRVLRPVATCMECS
jgi:hypothetical protein